MTAAEAIAESRETGDEVVLYDATEDDVYDLGDAVSVDLGGVVYAGDGWQVRCVDGEP